MNATLSARLKDLIAATDVGEKPLLIADAARLLSEVQVWEKNGEALVDQVQSLERTGRVPPRRRHGHEKGQADWAYEILADQGKAMHYREIAAEMKARGYEHPRQPKNPEKQLGDSVWTAMHEDSRFEKVGRGVFDLAERV